MDEKQEERYRCRTRDQLVEVRKRKDEEDDGQEEMQRNLDAAKNLDEILSKIKQTGWSEAARTRRFWAQDEDEEQ